MKQLNKTYNPKETESKIYNMWEEGGYFKPEKNNEGKPFTIMMPPPNITGQLHIGHALNLTVQDVLIRFKRMNGYKTLWLPGEDHASIATEVKIINKIFEEEHKTKQEIGREEFLKRAWDWTAFYRKRIAQQARKLGASCDWDRERFTMDKGLADAVNKAFLNLYNKKLIYKANRIINWCPECKTALSDAEVEYEEQNGNLWHIKYPIKDSDKFVIVATTRPETMLGDSAVAVNPNDERYSDIIGKTAVLPLVNREIPIIADEYVDMEFGTGCVKITPCHDPNDFEVGLRHNLAQHKVMNDDASINELGGKYSGLTREKARAAIIKDLDDLGLLEKTQPHIHNVGTCYRCHTSVEPITSVQWFVKMQPLAIPAIEAVKNGSVKFVPDRFKKIYVNWMENIKDWCISRQLWWGHRIPAYYCCECGEMVVASTMPSKCSKCGCTEFKQDEDVLDTWFSSALWPFSTLGWPEETDDFKEFYPNNVLVTAPDIIFFWVARMIFSGIEHCKDIPFTHVFIHGLVRDDLGRKMSKSLGNGVDPLEVIDNYGADALRFALLTGSSAGNDTRWQLDKINSARNFANKINNAARFILMNLEGYDINYEATHEHFTNIDKWIITRLSETVEEVTQNINKFEIGLALEKIYNFTWSEFCDWYIEFSKTRLYSDDEQAKKTAQWTIYNVFVSILKLLHPFMPFITEDIYLHFNEKASPLIISKWPESMGKFPAEKVQVSEITDAIRAIRNARAKMNIPPSKKAHIYIAPNKGCESIFKGNEEIFIKLASADKVIFEENYTERENALSVVTSNAKYSVPLDTLIDKAKELERIMKEKSNIENGITRLEKKLANKDFLAKAPAKIVEAEKNKLEKYVSLLKEINESIS